MVWTCLSFIKCGQNHLARHSERGKKTRQTEEEVGRQHQGIGLEFAESQRAVGNREKWKNLVVKPSVVPQRPLRLRDRCWWCTASNTSAHLSIIHIMCALYMYVFGGVRLGSVSNLSTPLLDFTSCETCFSYITAFSRAVICKTFLLLGHGNLCLLASSSSAWSSVGGPSPTSSRLYWKNPRWLRAVSRVDLRPRYPIDLAARYALQYARLENWHACEGWMSIGCSSSLSSVSLSPRPRLHVVGMMRAYVFDINQLSLPILFIFCSCVCFSLYGPFNCISFHKFSRQ